MVNKTNGNKLKLGQLFKIKYKNLSVFAICVPKSLLIDNSKFNNPQNRACYIGGSMYLENKVELYHCSWIEIIK